MPPQKQYTATEVMSMNRKDRRRLGKLNGVKIPGIQDKIKSNKKKKDEKIH